MPELISCYYYAPHNHSLLAGHLRRDLEHMVEMGTHAVAFCLQESQLTNWHQQRVRNVVDTAHAVGLKVHVVPNRWAGLVAGWIDGFGDFPFDHPETLIRNLPGETRFRSQRVSCINHPLTRAHIKENIHKCFTLFDFDGFIWDEPHAVACACDHCLKRNDGKADELVYHLQFAEFVDEMSAYAKELRPGCVISLFTQPFQRMMIETFLDKANIDYVGADGHIRRPEYQMHRMKRTLFETHDEYYPLIQAAGKKSYFLLEAQRHRDEDLGEYLAQVEAAFSLPMDHLMYYYSAHEMSCANEDAFNRATWEQVRRIANQSVNA